MYKYTYVEASVEGWRFVSFIPSLFRTHGVIKQFDLVFEKEE